MRAPITRSSLICLEVESWSVLFPEVSHERFSGIAVGKASIL